MLQEPTFCSKDVLKANVKGGVRVGCESHSFLSNYILRSPILIIHSIFDLDKIQSGVFLHLVTEIEGLILTCMFTTCPSPCDPLTVAVTTTKVSFPTKLRIHRWYFAWFPGCAWRSNLSPTAVEIRKDSTKSDIADHDGLETLIMAEG